MRRHKCKKKIQRAFFAWLESNWLRFNYRLKIEKRTEQYVLMSLVGINPAVTATLTWCIDIPVMWKAQCWDILASFEAMPHHGVDGYYCSLCPPNKKSRYSTREELWQAEIFEPFLRWVNRELAAASYIEFQEGAGFTAARLSKTQPLLSHASLKL